MPSQSAHGGANDQPTSSAADCLMAQPIIPLPVEITEIKLEVDGEESQTTTFLGFPISSRISQLEQQIEGMRNLAASLQQEFNSVREISQRIESNWNTALDVDLNEDVQNLFNLIDNQIQATSSSYIFSHEENSIADGTHSNLSGNYPPLSSSDREDIPARSLSSVVEPLGGPNLSETCSEPMVCMGDTSLSSVPDPSIPIPKPTRRSGLKVFPKGTLSGPKIFRKGTRSSPRLQKMVNARKEDADLSKGQEIPPRTENNIYTGALDVEVNQGVQGGPNFGEVQKQGNSRYAFSREENSNADAAHNKISGNSSSNKEGIPARSLTSVVGPLGGSHSSETCSEPMDITITDSYSLSSVPDPSMPKLFRCSEPKKFRMGIRSSPRFRKTGDSGEAVMPNLPHVCSETMDWSNDHELSSGPGPSNPKPMGGSEPIELGEAAHSSSTFQVTDEDSAKVAKLGGAPNEPTHGIDASKGGSCFFCICGIQFVEEGILNTHIRRFTQDWKFKCPECNVEFFSYSGLRNHIAATHKDSEQLTKDAWGCTKCGQVFSSKVLLHRHHRRAHVPAVGLRKG